MAVERITWVEGPDYWITTWPGGFCRAERRGSRWRYSLHNKAGLLVWRHFAFTRQEIEKHLIGHTDPGRGFRAALASVQLEAKPRKGKSK